MNISWYFIVAIAMLVSSQRGVGAPLLATDWEEATRLANETRRVRLVLLTGSDWDPASKPAMSLLTDPKFLAAADDCVLVQIDHPDHPNDRQKALLEKNEGFRHGSYHYPALMAFDVDEQPLGTADGITPNAQKWAEVVRKWLDQAKRRDDLLARAEKETGVARARLLGAALDALDFNIARRNGKWIDALKKADEQDVSGYVFKYTFNPYAMGEHEVATVGNQPAKLRNTLEKTEKHLANPVLTAEQKQQLHALRYGCYTRLSDLPQAQRSLEAAIALDPQTDTAQGAAALLARLKKQIQWDLAKKALNANPNDRAAASALLEVADAADLEKLPPFSAPPGNLVREPMELAFSSLSRRWDEPWKHALLTQGVYRGQFHTESEVRPWVTVKLPRARTIRGMVVFPSGPRERLVPLKMEVSRDGQMWHEVGRQDQEFEHASFDLSHEPRQAQWIRVSRDDARQEFFHLSNILVYGE